VFAANGTGVVTTNDGRFELRVVPNAAHGVRIVARSKELKATIYIVVPIEDITIVLGHPERVEGGK
jgi:hypothetical protein